MTVGRLAEMLSVLDQELEIYVSNHKTHENLEITGTTQFTFTGERMSKTSYVTINVR